MAIDKGMQKGAAVVNDDVLKPKGKTF